jgi:Cu+-exporting ATPase
LVAAVEDCGFECRLQSLHSVDTEDADERLQTARLHVGGMTCGACSGAVEKGLLALAGVTHAAVSLTQVRRP